VFHWIHGCDPRQYGLDFGLWTRSLVAELIERKFHIRLGVTAVGALLAKLDRRRRNRCDGRNRVIQQRSRFINASSSRRMSGRQGIWWRSLLLG
jgi:hypothetical protein